MDRVKPLIIGIAAEFLLAASLFFPNSKPTGILVFFVLQIPYVIISIGLARSSHDPARVQSWTRFASGLGIVYAILTGIAFMPFMIGLGFSISPGRSIQLFGLVGLIPANLYVAFAAMAVAKKTPTQRIGYPIIATLGSIMLIIIAVKAYSGYEDRRVAGGVKSRADEQRLIEQMNNVLACLEKYKSNDPDQAYPMNLGATVEIAGCSSLDTTPPSPAGYEFRYEPGQKPVNGKTASFRLEAVPQGHQLGYASPFVADSSGIIYARSEYGVYPMGGSDGASMLSRTRLCIQEVARLSGTRDTDTILGGLRDRCYDAGQPSNGWENLDGTLVFHTTRPTGYNIDMQVVQHNSDLGLAITGTGRCINYPTQCLRSYFMDERGDVHGIPQPRQATLDDPLVPPCETMTTPCDPNLVK